MGKIQLTITNNFITSIGNDKEHVMHSKSDKIQIMISAESNEVINKLFDSLRNRYQNNLELMKVLSLSLIMFSCCTINVIK